MKTDIAIHLFGGAEFETQEIDVSREGIRGFADEMADKLRHVADLVGVLQGEGWNFAVVHDNLVGTHPDVWTHEDATGRLDRLGIDSEALIDIGVWDDHGKRLNPA